MLKIHNGTLKVRVYSRVLLLRNIFFRRSFLFIAIKIVLYKFCDQLWILVVNTM